jgi:phosphoglycerol transferase MdoB-like AlkP superfamily enzyme
MSWNRVALGAVFAALLAATLACGGEVNVSSAKVADAYMSADEDGANRTTVYSQDATFYAQVDLQNAPDDTVLKAIWTAVDAQDTDPGLVMKEMEYTTGSDKVYFTLSNNDPWPTGTYKVDIYLNAELVNTLDFSVQ